MCWALFFAVYVLAFGLSVRCTSNLVLAPQVSLSPAHFCSFSLPSCCALFLLDLRLSADLDPECRLYGVLATALARRHRRVSASFIRILALSVLSSTLVGLLISQAPVVSLR